MVTKAHTSRVDRLVDVAVEVACSKGNACDAAQAKARCSTIPQMLLDIIEHGDTMDPSMWIRSCVCSRTFDHQGRISLQLKGQMYVPRDKHAADKVYGSSTRTSASSQTTSRIQHSTRAKSPN